MKKYFEILRYGKNFSKNLSIAFLFLGLYNLLSAFTLTLIIPFLEIIFAQDAAPQRAEWNWFSLEAIKRNAFFWLYSQMAIYGKAIVLGWFCVFVFIAILLKNFFRYLSSWKITPLELSIIQNIRDKIFEHLAQLSLSFYTHKQKGHLLSLVVSDVEVIQRAVLGTLMPLFSDPITMIIFLALMFIISWKLSLLTLIVLPVTGFFINKISRSLRNNARKGQMLFDQLLSMLDEFISGIRIVKAYSKEEYEKKRYANFNKKYTQISIKLQRRSELASPVTEILTVAVILFIIYYGASLIIASQMELKPSEFIGFIVLFSQMIAPIKTFSSAISRIQKAIVSYDRIVAFLNEPVQATEKNYGKQVGPLQKEIRFENVSFSYGEQMVLKNLSFSIKKGETVAIIGPSGAGKTTLIDLIARFYEPTQGNIFWDDENYSDINPISLRSQMGIVTQEAILFNDTIAHNIAYGEPNYPQPKIVEAAQVANASGFISQMAAGYQTIIGERGSRLSGGQRQRIALARAILKDPCVLILDEATSALDSESEKLVQQALDRIIVNRTCIVIAHRLSTIQNADKIIVLNNGQIEEQGTHTELLRKNGLYRKLYEIQSFNSNGAPILP
ncbi:MAG: ABC transporter ATP-binding protein [Bacteroidia bacterium]|nr:ABC transporter ATP-binding protein/permease [Bacteroidia bacterium]MDW8157296.1 ABC transporter ATP-binding protein [Bacteroidia bacterium]